MKKYYTYLPYIAWTVAFIAMLSSLYFSEIRHFTPCVLCWYQRITMYPLFLILLVGILRKDKNLPYYVLPLSIIGIIISLFHNLLYYKIIPDNLAPCANGVSCTTKFIEYFGFVTIPLLSFIAFLIITISMLLYKHYIKKYE